MADVQRHEPTAARTANSSNAERDIVSQNSRQKSPRLTGLVEVVPGGKTRISSRRGSEAAAERLDERRHGLPDENFYSHARHAQQANQDYSPVRETYLDVFPGRWQPSSHDLHLNAPVSSPGQQQYISTDRGAIDEEAVEDGDQSDLVPSSPECLPDPSPELLRRDFDDIKRQRDAKDKELRQIRQKWHQASTEIFLAKSETLATIPDEKLREMWSEADYKLRSWAKQWSHHFWKSSRYSSTGWSRFRDTLKNNQERMQMLFAGDSKEFQACVRFPMLRVRFVQAIVWDIMRLNIFNKKLPYLGSEISNAFVAVSSHMMASNEGANPKDQTDAKRFHGWRASTVSLLSPLVRSDARKEWVDSLSVAISSKLEISKATIPHNHRYLTELRDIIHQMVHLDAELQQQRACFEVSAAWGDISTHTWLAKDQGKGFPFNESTMAEESSDSDQRGAPVMLVLTPMLSKRGTQGGENYHLVEPFCRSKVVSVVDWRGMVKQQEHERKLDKVGVPHGRTLPAV